MTQPFLLTKSDFLLYCQAPRHLWARKHGWVETPPSVFQQHLGEQGSVVEGLAQEYLARFLLPGLPGATILPQQPYEHGAYSIRVDALLQQAGGGCDLYEIKSSTGVDKENIQDVTFQACVLEAQVRMEHYYLLHLDKDYTRCGDLDLASLFLAEDITEKVRLAMPEVLLQRAAALQALQAQDPTLLEGCLSPRDCPCPDLCHPHLPEFSIYDIPRLSKGKKLELLSMGIHAAQDIPADFALNDKQRLVAECARSLRPHLDLPALQEFLERLTFPLWFLDYETCISAVPLYDGYIPQQQVVFQYSLHRLDTPAGEVQHAGCIALAPGDPALELLGHLSQDLGSPGSVIVWNKSFEMTMNRGMAKLHPQFAPFLEDVNERIFDLGEVVNFGLYLHPGFKGSWSLKNVLPVMVPELTYDALEINKGDQASMAWWALTFGDLDAGEKERLTRGLETYCAQDTLAMVSIFRRLGTLLADAGG